MPRQQTNMMIICCLILIAYLPSISCSRERKTHGNDTCSYPQSWNEDGVCLPNVNGYEFFTCKTVGTHNKWVQTKTTMCDEGDRCRCWDNDWYEPECECVNGRKFPSFPPTGVIRWKGTAFREDNWWVHYSNARKVSRPGEMRKDADGRFLHKWTQIGEWGRKVKTLPKSWVQFEIIVPHGKGKFMKLTGNGNSTKCKKSIVNKEGSLNKVFKNVVRQGRTYRLHDSKPIKGKDSLNKEIWRLEHRMEDGGWYWEWTVKFDTKKKFAYPVQSWSRVEDGFIGTYDKDDWWYSYEPLGKNDISFSVEDYCDNV